LMTWLDDDDDDDDKRCSDDRWKQQGVENEVPSSKPIST